MLPWQFTEISLSWSTKTTKIKLSKKSLKKKKKLIKMTEVQQNY